MVAQGLDALVVMGAITARQLGSTIGACQPLIEEKPAATG